jgi:hypothetical protein
VGAVATLLAAMVAATRLFLAALLALGQHAAAQDPKPEPAKPPTAPAAQPEYLLLPGFTGFAYPDPEGVRRDSSGSATVRSGELRFYVHFAHPGELKLGLLRSPVARDAPATNPVTIRAMTGDAAISVTQTRISHATRQSRPQEPVQSTIHYRATIVAAGYHCITVVMPEGSTQTYQLQRLELSGAAIEAAHASDVERRNAASVHLGYPVPKAQVDEVEWFYCEVTPKTDPLWTYYMATGWSRGYFGMQVNSPTERRVIFSVWDSGNEAIDRSKVAADDLVQLVGKGDGVVAEGFGNEGTGGHSHLVHDWKLGDTFRFLVRAEPDGTHTTYTGWFWFAERKQWGLIASFRAPKDGKRLRGLYSFNENFSGANGDLLRDCEFGNVWARTSGGEWLPLRTARFTHDGHGNEQRLDRSAGIRGERFYLQNGGFVPAAEGAVTKARSELSLATTTGKPPGDDELASLPDPRAKR